MEKEFSIKIMLDRRRAKANGKFPLRLWVFNMLTKNSKRYPTTFDFSEKEFESIWETRKPRLEYKETRRELEAIENRAEEIAETIIPFTFEKFERKLFNEVGAGGNVFFQFDEIIKELNNKGRFGTASSYQQSLMSIKVFLKYENGSEPTKLQFTDINTKWLERYEKYMTVTKKRSPTTVGMYLRGLRVVFNKAIFEKEISNESYPFGKKLYQIPAAKKVKKALNKDQLKLLLNAKAKNIEQEKARDFWFFSYSCNGMNIKDIAQLKFEDFKDNTLVFYRAKTINTKRSDLTPVIVYLTKFAEEIIEKYSTKSKKPKNYIFPIISDADTEYQKYHKIKNFTRFINQNLKVLANDIGITESISTYWARHSFATYAIRSGASIEFVSEALSHSDIKTTKGYFAGFADETKKEFAESLMDF